MKLKIIILTLLLNLIWGLHGLWAQCSQCKATAASRDENGQLFVGTGMNDGVLFLLALPFLAVLTLGGIWLYRNYLLRQGRVSS